MTPAKRQWGLPLLARELIEQAARKRTYVLRVLYALLLFSAAFLVFHETLRVGRASPFAALGRGREMFTVLVGLQFAGVYLFMPAISCGVLTQEKEKNSLMLLFLTRLGPWTIVLEKLVSRLVPMLCFLLLSLPLLAFAYALGGISAESLWGGVWMLIVATVQMGSLAVLCSAWFRTTVGAFVWSYLFALGILFGPALAAEVLTFGQTYSSPLLGRWREIGFYRTLNQLLFPFFAPVQFFDSGPLGSGGDLAHVMLRSLPILAQSAVFLALARLFVVRRAFVPPRNLVMNLFQAVDRVFVRLNRNRLTRGIVLVGDASSLPDEQPVAWRETTKRSLGRARYLFRIFLAIEIPLGVICFLIALWGGDPRLEGASAMLFVLWPVAVLMVSVQAASLIAGERSHQTLDVLATTPLSGRRILLEKFRGVRRLMLVLLVPFFTIFLFELFWKSSFTSNAFWGRRFEPAVYFVCSALSVTVYLPLAAWLSLLIGLCVRTQGRAIIAALGAIVGWCVLPLIFIALPVMIVLRPMGMGPPSDGWVFLTLLSPASIVPMNEFLELHEYARMPWLAITLNFLGYGFALVVIRQFCLLGADRFLGRAESVE